MKHLKSSLGDLRQLFERTVTIRDIAEPLVSFDSDHDADAVRGFMTNHSFDTVGIREHGHVRGYVLRETLGAGSVGDSMREFDLAEVLADTSPLTDAFKVLRDRKQVFVTVLGRVGGIVSRADLQKAPVRMWLFSLISLAEMHMQRLIQEAFPAQGWQRLISEERLRRARDLFSSKRQRNVETDLSDCLQWADKAAIFCRTRELLEASGQASTTSAKRLFSRIEQLRNDLAHSGDIIHGRWPELADRAIAAETLLQNLEKAVVLRQVD